MTRQPKKVLFADDVRYKLSKGISTVAKLLNFLHGPTGKNIALESKWGPPKITQDGSTTSKELSVKDSFENLGVFLAKDVIERVEQACGDGTTRAVILLDALVKDGIKQIAAGASPIKLKKGIDIAVERLSQEIEKSSFPVQDKQLAHLATVSAGGDFEIGRTIATALAKAGQNGLVTIEKGNLVKTQIEIITGMQIDQGYLTPYFSTHSENMTASLEDVYILIAEKRISSIHDLLPILQQMTPTGKQLLIIAEDITGDALSTLIANRLKGTLKVAAIKAPGFGEQQKTLLEDLAILTGTQVMSEERSFNLKEVNLSQLGFSKHVLITKNKTTFTIGKIQNPKALENRILQIEYEIDNTSSQHDLDRFKERKAKLMGKIAQIQIGGMTEPEMDQQEQIYKESLNSTLSAMEGGSVIGGGVALLRAAQQLYNSFEDLPHDEQVGAKSLLNVCSKPLEALVNNAGMDGLIIAEQVKQQENHFGFNANSYVIEDLLENNVIDPKIVVLKSLQIAASGAGNVLLSEVAMVEDKENQSFLGQ